MWRSWLSCLFTPWPRVFKKVQLKKSSVQNGFERRLPHNSKVESQDRLLCWDLPLSGIHFSSLDGSARLVDVARHLLSSAEAIITAASSDGIVRVVTFQLIPQEGSEVKISACGGHGFPVFHPLATLYSPSLLALVLWPLCFMKPGVQMQSREVVGCWQWRELEG